MDTYGIFFDPDLIGREVLISGLVLALPRQTRPRSNNKIFFERSEKFKAIAEKLNVNFYIFVFFLLLSLISLFEGLGLPNGREVSLIFILFMPIFLFSLDFLYKRKIIFPKTQTLLFCAFLLFSVISTIFSVDLQRSVLQTLFYIACFFIFIQVFNHKTELEKKVIIYIFILSALFCFYTIFLRFLPGNSFLIPANGYEFVYSKFGVHNHLGDYLILPIIIVIYLFFKEKINKYIFLLVIFLPLFFLSYSRSAYFALFVTLVFLIIHFIKEKTVKMNSKIMLIIYPILFTILLFFVIAVLNLSKTPILKQANVFLYDRCSSNNCQKILVGGRIAYFLEAGGSFLKNPYFGVGPGNFIYVSRGDTKYPHTIAYSSHNLFLDILSENGIFAFFAFLGFIITIFRKSEKKLYLFLLLGLLLNFMLDYTHLIFSFFILFFIFSGFSFSAKK